MSWKSEFDHHLRRRHIVVIIISTSFPAITHGFAACIMFITNLQWHLQYLSRLVTTRSLPIHVNFESMFHLAKKPFYPRNACPCWRHRQSARTSRANKTYQQTRIHDMSQSPIRVFTIICPSLHYSVFKFIGITRFLHPIIIMSAKELFQSLNSAKNDIFYILSHCICG